LIEGLKHDPCNPTLTGALRRHYRPAPAFDLWMLAASVWRTEAGARGLTMHGFAPLEKQWRSVTLARGPGMDPSFSPRAAYTMPLWGAGRASAFMGKTLHFKQPLVAEDGSVAPTLPEPVSVGDRIASARAMIEAGAAHLSWREVRRDL